jgi:hypothetical protein
MRPGRRLEQLAPGWSWRGRNPNDSRTIIFVGGPAEHGKQSIEIELSHPVNPSEHEGAGSITWGASLDRLAPLGEEAVGIIKQAWAQRAEDPRAQVKRERTESESVERVPTADASVKPGWAARIDRDQYWIRLTLYQPVMNAGTKRPGSTGQAGNSSMTGSSHEV